MVRPSYLIKDPSGVYYFRYNFPLWARNRDPQIPRWIKLSLKTKEKEIAYFRAKSLWLKVWSELFRAQGMKILDNSSRLPISDMLKRYRDYIASAEPYIQSAVYWGKPQYRDVEDAISQQLELIEAYNLTQFLDQEDFHNLDELCEKAKYIQEANKQQDIDAVVQSQIASPQNAVTNKTTETSQKTSLSLSALFEDYMQKKVKEGNWKTSSLTSHKAKISFLIEAVGDLPANELTKKDIRDLRDKLDQKTNHQRHNQLLSKVTKNQYIQMYRTLFEFGVSTYDEIIENPFDNKEWKFAVKKQDKRIRVAWPEDDLKKMFSHSIFTTGKGMFHPYYYWMPILGLCTGARLNELCQLHCEDIKQVNGINFISINLDHPKKSIKTGQPRDVPIHNSLVKLGFLKMVKYMTNSGYQFLDEDGYKRLWRGTKFTEPDRSYKKNVSSWFNSSEKTSGGRAKGFKHQLGISFNQKQRKDFHSFRHTFATLANHQGMDKATSFQITGHMSDDVKRVVGDHYIHGKNLQMLNDAMQKLDFDKLLDPVKPFFELVKPNKLKGKVTLK